MTTYDESLDASVKAAQDAARAAGSKWDQVGQAAADAATSAAAAQSAADTSAASAASSASSAAASAGLVGAPAGAAVDARLSSGPGLVVAATATIADVQTALDTAATNGQRAVAYGSITTSTTLTIKADCDLSQLTINYTGTGVAVRLGDESAVVWRLRVRLPKVINAGKVGLGWTAGTVGVRAVNLNACSQIDVPYISGFESGLVVHGQGQGNSYNTFQIGHLDNNKRNLVLSADATGWSNQNTYVGGRYGHNSAEGTDVVDSRHILLTVVPNPVNNNVWVNPSVEGTTAEQMIDVDGGAYNIWINPRLERTGGGRIRWGATATQNQIIGGYNAGSVLITRVSGEAGNTIKASNLNEVYGSSTQGVQRLQNRSSDAYPAVTMYGAASLADADWRWKWCGNQLEGKRVSESFSRIVLDGNNGRITLGTGTVAPSFDFRAVGTSGVSLNGGNFYAGTDNTYDIGLTSSLRFRDLNLGRNAVVGGTLKVTGNVGFYGTTPAAKPTVSGSRTDGSALASLLTALAGLGLITDSTTA
jgi:hypothetical protein